MPKKALPGRFTVVLLDDQHAAFEELAGRTPWVTRAKLISLIVEAGLDLVGKVGLPSAYRIEPAVVEPIDPDVSEEPEEPVPGVAANDAVLEPELEEEPVVPEEEPEEEPEPAPTVPAPPPSGEEDGDGEGDPDRWMTELFDGI
jgi:hypothetical protein